MKLKPIHYSMLSLGVTAVGVVVAIWYYRQQQAAAAASTGDSAAAASPLFQTAAIPSSGAGGGVSGGGGGGAPAGAVSPTGLSGDQLASISSDQITATSGNTAAAIDTNSANTFAAITSGLVSQILGQLPSVTPGAANELNFSATALSPNNLSISTSYAQTTSPYYQPPTTPTPLTYATPQGTQVPTAPAPPPIQFQPMPTGAAPYISPPYMPVVPFENAPSTSGGE